MTSYVFNVAKDLILQGDLGLDDPTHGHASGTGTYAPGTFRVLLLQDGNQLAKQGTSLILLRQASPRRSSRRLPVRDIPD